MYTFSTSGISKNELLEHSLRAIDYRFTKAIHRSAAHFGEFKISDHTRSPNEIINHMCDLVIKTTSQIKEGHLNSPSPEPLDFNGEVKRFISNLHQLIGILNETEVDPAIGKKLLQGPILDMTTHIGQLAMLNGLHGNKISKENYFDADI